MPLTSHLSLLHHAYLLTRTTRLSLAPFSLPSSHFLFLSRTLSLIQNRFKFLFQNLSISFLLSCRRSSRDLFASKRNLKQRFVSLLSVLEISVLSLRKSSSGLSFGLYFDFNSFFHFSFLALLVWCAWKCEGNRFISVDQKLSKTE